MQHDTTTRRRPSAQHNDEPPTSNRVRAAALTCFCMSEVHAYVASGNAAGFIQVWRVSLPRAAKKAHVAVEKDGTTSVTNSPPAKVEGKQWDSTPAGPTLVHTDSAREDAMLAATGILGWSEDGQPMNISDKWTLVHAFRAHANGAAVRSLSFVEDVSRSSVGCRVLVSTGHDAESGIKLWSLAGQYLGEFAGDQTPMLKGVGTFKNRWSYQELVRASEEAALLQEAESFMEHVHKDAQVASAAYKKLQEEEEASHRPSYMSSTGSRLRSKTSKGSKALVENPAAILKARFAGDSSENGGGAFKEGQLFGAPQNIVQAHILGPNAETAVPLNKVSQVRYEDLGGAGTTGFARIGSTSATAGGGGRTGHIGSLASFHPMPPGAAAAQELHAAMLVDHEKSHDVGGPRATAAAAVSPAAQAEILLKKSKEAKKSVESKKERRAACPFKALPVTDMVDDPWLTHRRRGTPAGDNRPKGRGGHALVHGHRDDDSASSDDDLYAPAKNLQGGLRQLHSDLLALMPTPAHQQASAPVGQAREYMLHKSRSFINTTKTKPRGRYADKESKSSTTKLPHITSKGAA